MVNGLSKVKGLMVIMIETLSELVYYIVVKPSQRKSQHNHKLR